MPSMEVALAPGRTHIAVESAYGIGTTEPTPAVQSHKLGGGGATSSASDRDNATTREERQQRLQPAPSDVAVMGRGEPIMGNGAPAGYHDGGRGSKAYNNK